MVVFLLFNGLDRQQLLANYFFCMYLRVGGRGVSPLNNSVPRVHPLAMPLIPQHCLRTVWGLFGDCFGTVWGLVGDSLGTVWGLFWDSFGKNIIENRSTNTP